MTALKIVVIGAGPGGYAAAMRAAQQGAEATVIEREHLGGVCLNWGCIPSKIMIAAAELWEKFQRAAEFGIHLQGTLQFDLPELLARRQAVIEAQRKGVRSLFQQHQVRYLEGSAYIHRMGSLLVKNAGAPAVEIPWDRLIIAAGSRPAPLPGFPFDGERILSSNDALSLKTLPESIIIVGGGVIGCEFACLLSALGTKVILVEAMSRLLPLPSVDESCSTVLLREMKKRKINVLLGKIVVSSQSGERGLKVVMGDSLLVKPLSSKVSAPLTLEAEKMLVCIGRQPVADNYGLENIGVRTDDKGWILADETMRATVDQVYAVGDALGPAKIMLAHVASAEGQVAAENACGGSRIMDYSATPGCVFTMPEIACVGLTETQAQANGDAVRADSTLFRSLGKAQAIGDIAGQAKIISAVDTGQILGVHLIGPRATELIAEGTLAVRMGLTVTDLARTIHAHPTLAEIMAETAFKAVS